MTPKIPGVAALTVVSAMLIPSLDCSVSPHPDCLKNDPNNPACGVPGTGGSGGGTGGSTSGTGGTAGASSSSSSSSSSGMGGTGGTGGNPSSSSSGVGGNGGGGGVSSSSTASSSSGTIAYPGPNSYLGAQATSVSYSHPGAFVHHGPANTPAGKTFSNWKTCWTTVVNNIAQPDCNGDNVSVANTDPLKPYYVIPYQAGLGLTYYFKAYECWTDNTCTDEGVPVSFIPQDEMAQWPFNDGTFNDASPLGLHDLTQNGAVTINPNGGETGLIGDGYAIADGMLGSYLTAFNSNDFNFSGPFTLTGSFLASSTLPSPLEVIYGKRGNAMTPGLIAYWNTDGKINFFMNGCAVLASSQPADTDAWYNFMITRDVAGLVSISLGLSGSLSSVASSASCTTVVTTNNPWTLGDGTNPLGANVKFDNGYVHSYAVSQQSWYNFLCALQATAGGPVDAGCFTHP